MLFSRYITTPSTTTSTSDLSPPSAPPPPPPPLNIPPSRARRQLAARLALHGKQKALNGEKGEGEEREARGINPFKVEGEDDEDEEGCSDEEEGVFERSHRGFEDSFEDGDDGAGVSVTREAKRRTSLEDEDDDVGGDDGGVASGGVGPDDQEIVHVRMVEEVGESRPQEHTTLPPETETGGDGEEEGELVHIQHAESKD
ncbi:hypothetical protein DSL72_004099 [Monilinia vaccinii-corymbosi]|uniref:Uncharacterized protein n=1 Tax=Monilinia vaccinii-corymbosi TaxID=61207 RepID=A0A8A3NVR0_9HELO|nr:hypothetical protein DSL72_004099 [Monilinia vaccinii-corymbosi]